MAFNIALTGLRAASTDLEVTGNNIANASTIGFKRSRAEFADLYSNSALAIASNSVGDGVRVQNIRQQFAQGNITFTENGLDLAINGEGFFVVDDTAGARRYTRAGAFGVDKDGFIANGSGMRLQGFRANEEGVIGGILEDLVIETHNLAPARTTQVETRFNLDSSQPVLAQRGETLVANGLQVGTAVAGTVNGYSAQTIGLTLPSGTTTTLTTMANAEASAIAAQFSLVNGFQATATTVATLPAAGFNNTSGTMRVTVNGVPFDGYTTLEDLGNAINNSPTLVGVSAIMNGSDLVVTDNRGNNLQFGFSGDPADSFSLVGSDAAATTITLDSTSATGTVGGFVTVTLEEGGAISSASTDLFSSLTGTPFVNNAFSPTDVNTYNHATSTTVYDSLGYAHSLSMYFVKEPAVSGSPENLWTMYVLVDGQDVGDPLLAGGDPTRAGYSLVFNEDGSLNETLSDEVLISNWTPRNSDGNPTGASGPLTVAEGGTLPVPQPPTSSNFEIVLNQSTQYGGGFAITDLSQNGFATGRLTGLDIDDAGVIFARYSNSESQVLGQVALAAFNDVEGLNPIGDSTWLESVASGVPIIGAPGTSRLGTIRASSLEESNVDLSNQLVNLIIAQRNYQANAKTIETANAVTQTIINLR